MNCGRCDVNFLGEREFLHVIIPDFPWNIYMPYLFAKITPTTKLATHTIAIVGNALKLNKVEQVAEGHALYLETVIC